MRHRSPKSQNYYGNNFFHSPQKKAVNIINFDNQQNSLNNNNQNNNHLNFHYNRNNYNYYDEITKAFNFITFVLNHSKSYAVPEPAKAADIPKLMCPFRKILLLISSKIEPMRAAAVSLFREIRCICMAFVAAVSKASFTF